MTSIRWLSALLLIGAVLVTQAFVPASPKASRTGTAAVALNMVAQAPPPPMVEILSTTLYSREVMQSSSTTLQQGVDGYLSRSSSVQVALQERKIPTKEEIEAKKRNFNIIFWGTSVLK